MSKIELLSALAESGAYSPKRPGFPRQSPLPLAYHHPPEGKGAVYTVCFFIKSWMFFELFLFAKNIKFLRMGEFHCTSKSYLGTFILCAYHHLPGGTKLELGRGAPGEHHPQPTIPPPRLSRPANCDESQLTTSVDSESGPTPAGKTFPHSYPKTRVSEGDAYVMCNFFVPLVCDSSQYSNAYTGSGPKYLTTF